MEVELTPKEKKTVGLAMICLLRMTDGAPTDVTDKVMLNIASVVTKLDLETEFEQLTVSLESFADHVDLLRNFENN